MTSDVAVPAPETVAANGHGEAHTTAGFGALTLGSIGVVYGDIGTSPLYAFREAVTAASSGTEGLATPAAVLGVLSLILWALIVVVTLKYVVILLRADNNGEGGTLALMALAQRAVGTGGATIVLLGIISGALFYGDAVITPALSVLSAIEGMKDVTLHFEPYIVPLTVIILVGLFAVQSRGTARVAAFFGPIMCVWFAVIAVAAIHPIIQQPQVLFALNPLYAVSFMLHHGIIGFVTLGAVFLAVTGAEALYADLGHFGKRPIQTAWLFIVLPTLALNYLGQGALVLGDPDHGEPDQHDRAEEGGDARGAARLHGKQHQQDQHRERDDIGIERGGDELDAFDRRQHRQRRCDDGIAVEQRAADDAEQDDAARPSAGRGALRQRHQCERAALAVVIGPQQDHHIFQRDHDDQRPQDQRDDAKHRMRGRLAARACRSDGLAQRIERAGADVAIDHADAADHERGKTGGGMGVAMPVGRRRFRGGNSNFSRHGIEALNALVERI